MAAGMAQVIVGVTAVLSVWTVTSAEEVAPLEFWIV